MYMMSCLAERTLTCARQTSGWVGHQFVEFAHHITPPAYKPARAKCVGGAASNALLKVKNCPIIKKKLAMLFLHFASQESSILFLYFASQKLLTQSHASQITFCQPVILHAICVCCKPEIPHAIFIYCGTQAKYTNIRNIMFITPG